MELAQPELWPLLLILAGALSLVLVAAGIMLARRPSGRGVVAVANTRPIQAGRRFRRARLRYQALLGIGAVIAVLAIIVGALTAARPIAASSVTPETRNRDIVLCLDVSSSMKAADGSLLDAFDALVTGFAGERIALVLFDGSPLQVFPLTTDYSLTREYIAAVRSGLRGTGGFAFEDGTQVGRGTSLVGDGLAGCLLQFDQPESARSRTLIIATDNESGTDALVPLPRAVQLASERAVAMYALNPHHRDRADSHELAAAAASTGGEYFSTSDEAQIVSAVRSIVERVTADPATVSVGSPIRTARDVPEPLIWLLGALTLALFAFSWRLRL